MIISIRGAIMFNKSEIGENLKKYREALGLNTYNFAIAIDLDYTYLSKIERGVELPTSKTMVRILNILNMSFKEFLGGEVTAKKLYIEMIRRQLLNLTTDDLVYLSDVVKYLNTLNDEVK